MRGSKAVQLRDMTSRGEKNLSDLLKAFPQNLHTVYVTPQAGHVLNHLEKTQEISQWLQHFL